MQRPASENMKQTSEVCVSNSKGKGSAQGHTKISSRVRGITPVLPTPSSGLSDTTWKYHALQWTAWVSKEMVRLL